MRLVSAVILKGSTGLYTHLQITVKLICLSRSVSYENDVGSINQCPSLSLFFCSDSDTCLHYIHTPLLQQHSLCCFIQSPFINSLLSHRPHLPSPIQDQNTTSERAGPSPLLELSPQAHPGLICDPSVQEVTFLMSHSMLCLCV